MCVIIIIVILIITLLLCWTGITEHRYLECCERKQTPQQHTQKVIQRRGGGGEVSVTAHTHLHIILILYTA